MLSSRGLGDVYKRQEWGFYARMTSVELQKLTQTKLNKVLVELAKQYKARESELLEMQRELDA